MMTSHSLRKMNFPRLYFSLISFLNSWGKYTSVQKIHHLVINQINIPSGLVIIIKMQHNFIQKKFQITHSFVWCIQPSHFDSI